jgi:hypothetical protein
LVHSLPEPVAERRTHQSGDETDRSTHEILFVPVPERLVFMAAVDLAEMLSVATKAMRSRIPAISN